ncbi:plasmid segregation oscillating ATPase ParF [Granulicella rosea]|uniref:Plasmid segregation oscillating ATPase ParF n=1 Tax=Granulicella rosea TaxID=474952 RepID=A0A239MQE1_9BACT|nr:ParA family protein [Granulicella rosea]SNT44342.1 plasmid segregation oscillating ATPase ParF [Granulicella rosea]
MIITLASYKGGAGKTTSAVHLAAYFQTLAPTLLLDGDKTKNALNWSQRGNGFSFRVAPVDQAARLAKSYEHIVIDTGQRPDAADLKEAVDACDLLIIPATPSPLDTDGLIQTVLALKKIGTDSFRVLLTKVPPPPERDAMELRKLLEDEGVSIFKGEIPRLKAFEKAAGAGEIVQQTNDRNANRAWDSYMAIGKELM